MRAWQYGNDEVAAECEADARAFEEANREEPELTAEEFWDKYAPPVQRRIDFTTPPTENDQ